MADVNVAVASEVNAEATGMGFVPAVQTDSEGNTLIIDSVFVVVRKMKLLGGSLYQATNASGDPIEGNPGENGTGTILQGFLETSNVDPVKELVTLIKTQRAFELNSQSIQTADQALQTVGNLRRM